VKFCRVFVLLTAALFLCAGRPVLAAPALWLVQGPVGKVYLFGTVHLLRDGVEWRSLELEAAIAQSKDLYLEVADPASLDSMAGPLLKLGFDGDHVLSSKISKADLALLDAELQRYGLGSEARYEHMQPWLVALVLQLRPATHSGYAAGNGVDLQVRKEFADAGKPVNGLESVATQLHIFSDLSQADQVAMLDEELQAHPQTNVSELDSIVRAWQTGDQDQIAKILQFDKYSTSPMYQRMLVNRNESWARELSTRLQQPGTSFVSVGAAHMLGPKGLPALLSAMGFTVTRVSISQMEPAPLPSSSSSATAGATPLGTASPSPGPSASATPLPQFLTPPHGWTSSKMSPSQGSLKTDMMWSDPKRNGVIMASHIDVPSGLATLNLDAFDALFAQGLLSDPSVKVMQPSRHVKICNGTQDGTLTVISSQKVVEEIVLAMWDRGYVAQYVRRMGSPEDPAAVRALLSVCAPPMPATR
jgi:uncharacterized protein YbaP (TraB family)